MMTEHDTPLPLHTDDGTLTLRAPGHGETYHSRHGARQESLHVFIDAADLPGRLAKRPVAILEVGFGTGLNLALALDEANRQGGAVHYTGFDPAPPGASLIAAVLDSARISPQHREAVLALRTHGHVRSGPSEARLHRRCWPAPLDTVFDVVWHDAFSPTNAPELWTDEVLAAEFAALRPGGVWVSYCARGAVRRALERIGFTVERLPGPPGKREMLRATRC